MHKRRKLDLACLLKTIIVKSTVIPFRWHECKYMCFYCCEHFLESSKLKDHLDTHPDVDLHEILIRTVNKEQRIKLDVSQIWCTVCPEELDSFDDYIDHLSESHNRFFDKDVVGRFETFKLADDELNCLECDKSFVHFAQLLSHTHQSHVNAEKNHRYLCEICGQGFGDKGSVSTHIRQAHSAHQCKYCSEAFQTHYALDKHMGSVHMTEKFKCPVCSEVLPNRYMKKRHLALVHDWKSVQLSCDICNKVFIRNNKLLMHKRRVHLKEKNVPCDVCGILCFDAEALKKHKICHSEVRPFRCEVCQKVFRSKRALIMHISKNHASDGK